MNLKNLVPTDIAIQARTFEQAQMVSLRQVELPSTFTPHATDLIFLQVLGETEVHMDARVHYRGSLEVWKGVMARSEGAGNSRLVVRTAGGFRQALDETCELVNVAFSEAPILRSLPERMPLGLQNLVDVCRHRSPALFPRPELLRALKTNLLRESKPGVILLGEPGVGKTSVVYALAAELAGSQPRSPLHGTPMWELNLCQLLEHGGMVGGLEREVRKLTDVAGQPIFFVDEAHQFGRSELRGLAQALKPALADGRVRMIAASTTMEWRNLADKAFQRRFLELRVPEPSTEETFEMVRHRIRALENYHGICISDQLLREAIVLAARFVPWRKRPDSAIDLLDHAAAIQNVDENLPTVSS